MFNLGKNVFGTLAKPLQRLLTQKDFGEPTRPQVEAIPLILEGKNVLLIAPAGTGKTEAAFLPVLHQLLSAPRERGIKTIYITPLRALNRDMLDRLEWWCKALDLKVSVRHGDTTTDERRKQAISPPDILITTPETFQVLMMGRRLSHHLGTVRWVIVDEIHELAEDKRGSQLALSLERLRRLKAGDFQLIGLSATIGSPQEVAKFLVGEGRQCELIDVSVVRELKMDVIYPAPTRQDEILASDLYTFPQVAARLRAIRKLIEAHGSTLVFTNTRPMAEVLASRFRLWDLKFPVGIHHGSLSSFARLRAEQGLKAGELKGVISTSSMELGLDIGKIDLVVQYNSPRQVTRLIQRVGRSGHHIGGVAEGAIIVQDPDDALESVVIASRSHHRELEPVSIPEKPLDVLMHTLVAMMAFQHRVGVDDAHEIIRRAHPFKDLTKEEVLDVLRYMQSLSKRLTWLSPDDREFVMPRGKERVFNYYFKNLSMIPELRQYLVVDDTRNEPVGVLDESFIAEYGSPSVKFVMAGKLWKIIQVFKDKVYVKPDDDPLGAIPTWIGEEIPVPYSVAQEVGKIKSRVEELTKQGLKLAAISRQLAESYGVKPEVMELALADAHKQAKQGLPLPRHDRVIIEKFEDIHVIHAHFGTLVNRTLARLLAHKASEDLGETTAISVDPYRILLKSGSLEPEQLLEIMKGKLGGDFERDLHSIIEESRFFSFRIVQVARRMGVLEEEAEISSSMVDKLMRVLRGTPVYEETFKEVVHKDLDLDLTVEVAKRINDREIELVSLGVRQEPTPMSSSVRKQRYLALEPVAPERLKLLAIASAKARLLSEVRTFVCAECGQYIEEKHIHGLDDHPSCPKCGSSLIGMVEETPDDVQRVLSLVERLPAAGKRNELWKEMQETSKLISKHGKLAAVALVGRGVKPEDAKVILEGEKKLSGKFLELILNKEREVLLWRFRGRKGGFEAEEKLPEHKEN
jgi:ATP-dependent Lhr-like helicase